MATDGVIDAFRAYLREHNLPITAQRLAIADIILGSASHLSAEDIMLELGARGASATATTSNSHLPRSAPLMVRR